MSFLQRKTLVGLLRRLLNSLHRHSGNLEKAEVIGARVPILKCMMRFPGAPEALPVDISLGVVNGASLVVFLRRQVIALPPLRPLVLAVKALLRDRGLNEVFTGGVGSYAVVNLVVAHLQEQGYSIDPPFPEPLSGKKSKKAAAADAAAASERVAELLRGDMEQQTLTFLQRLAAGEVGTVGPRSPGFDSQGSPIQQTAGQQAPPAQPARVSDLGMLLWGFFERFGAGFDYVRRAVSVRNGGIVTKGAFAVGGKPWLLAVEDPQEPGKDICSGSYRAHELREEFVAASDLLAEACEDLEANMRSGGSGANEPDLAAQAAQRTQQGTSILGLLIDLQAAVGRGPEAAAARAALEQRAAAVRDEVLQYRTAAAMKRSWSDAEDERPAKRRKGERRGAGVIGHGAPVRPGKAPKRVVMSGGKPRGSKNRRAVEAQWKDRRGQYFEA